MAEVLPGHSDFILRPRSTDYIKGVNSPIVFRAVSNGDWTPYIQFFENQKLQFETNGCALFAAQESFDAQMDNLITSGVIPAAMLAQFDAMGYMDTGLDGRQHFHSSARFLQVLTGNGFNGNAAPDPWDVMRKYGVLPWKDLPYDATISQAEYLAPIKQDSLDKAAQFLALIGGKNAIEYHWIVNDAPKNVSAMAQAMSQAPLCIGVAVNVAGWNQTTPTDPSPTAQPVHSVMIYRQSDVSAVLDHYVPYQKILDAGYPIHFALQGIVTIIAQIEQQIIQTAAQITTAIKTSTAPVAEKAAWYSGLVQALQTLLAILSPSKVGSAPQVMNTYSLLRSRTFWTIFIGFAYNVWQLLEPSVAPQTSVILDAIFAMLGSYFHYQTGISTTGTN